jgi:hypothetical protein
MFPNRNILSPWLLKTNLVRRRHYILLSPNLDLAEGVHGSQPLKTLVLAGHSTRQIPNGAPRNRQHLLGGDSRFRAWEPADNGADISAEPISQ